MMIIYIITRFLTCFGAVLRAFWEHLACRICKIPVEDIRVFKNDELCGHIEHEIPEKLSHSFAVCFLPFTMNFILGCSFLLTGSYRLFYIGESTSFSTYALVWLGFSCLANCVPSFEDMLSFKDRLYAYNNKVVKILLLPLYAIIFAGAYSERYSLTFVLSLLFTIFFPTMFNVLFPILDITDQMLY